MAELDDLDTRARLAVLEVMGWPDDRDHPGTDDGVPPAAHWTLAGELVAAVAPLFRPLPGEARPCPGCGRSIGLTQHGRFARHQAHGFADWCPASNRLVSDHTTTDQGGPDGRC